MTKMKFSLAAALLLATFSGCQKDTSLEQEPDPEQTEQLSISDAQLFYQSAATQQAVGGLSLKSHSIDWKRAKSVNYKEGNIVAVPIPGQPKVDDVKLGFRKMVFYKDKSGSITYKYVEVVPDLIYAWRNRGIKSKNFTGQVFIYTPHYALQKGFIYKEGKVTGLIEPAPKKSSGGTSVSSMYIVESCEWQTDGFINSEGIIELVRYKACSYSIYDDGFDAIAERNYPWNDGGGGSEIIEGGGGPPSSPEPTYPELVIEAPGEQITLESALECLGLSVGDQGSFKVTLFADAPVNNDLSSNFNFSNGNPGHTFVQLSATIDGRTSTLSFGFYPFTGAKSTFMDNVSSKTSNDQNHEYEASITFDLTREQIGQLISGYKVGATRGYDLVRYNCVDFAVGPLKSLGFDIPSGERNVSMYGKMQTPAGLVQGLKNKKASNPNANSNIEDSGSKTSPANQGGCNKTF